MAAKWVIIVGGGIGTRMGAEVPKQFLLLDNKPIIIHTIQQFQAALSEINIVVVLPEAHQHTFFDMAKKFSLDNILTANGGATRFQSVKNGLEKIDAADNDLIAVHDAVRPFAGSELIKKIYKETKEADAVIPVIAVKESIRKVTGDTSVALQRENYKIVQTPQCFKAAILKKAYQQQEDISFTDDASVVEKLGVNIKLIAGVEENIKITHPADLEHAELIFKRTHTN